MEQPTLDKTQFFHFRLRSLIVQVQARVQQIRETQVPLGLRLPAQMEMAEELELQLGQELELGLVPELVPERVPEQPQGLR